MKEAEEVQVPVNFITDEEFEAKDWPEYGVTVSEEFPEEDFQRDFCRIVESLENALVLEGWKRGLIRPHDDYEIFVEGYRPHRSLDFGIISDRMLCPILIPVLVAFLRLQSERWMIHISDERWTPETGYNIGFKMVVEPDAVWFVTHNEDTLMRLGIGTPEVE